MVEYKDDNSPLTLADRRANDVIQQHLAELPHIPCLSEESSLSDYSERKNWQEFFIIDPIDGTKEFVKKNGEFTVNIGYMKNNQPVAGVVYAPAQKQNLLWCMKVIQAGMMKTLPCRALFRKISFPLDSRCPL